MAELPCARRMEGTDVKLRNKIERALARYLDRRRIVSGWDLHTLEAQHTVTRREKTWSKTPAHLLREQALAHLAYALSNDVLRLATIQMGTNANGDDTIKAVVHVATRRKGNDV